METDNENRPIRIFILGRFEILREGDSVRFVRKVQRKPLELLKAIISFGGKKVPEDQITDTLWPDAEGDMAHQSFETTLYRLRRLLGNDMVIVLQGGQLTLDDKYCWLDTWAFDQICEKIEIFFKRMEESDKKKPWEILVPEIRNSKRETQDPAIQNTSSATIEYLQSAIEDTRLLPRTYFEYLFRGPFSIQQMADEFHHPIVMASLPVNLLTCVTNNKFVHILINLCRDASQRCRFLQRGQKAIAIHTAPEGRDKFFQIKPIHDFDQ